MEDTARTLAVVGLGVGAEVVVDDAATAFAPKAAVIVIAVATKIPSV